MNGGALFFLMAISAANPEVEAPTFGFDSYLKCMGFKEALQRNAVVMNPQLEWDCKQAGLPAAEVPE
jgi:hypothetical protein